MCRLRDFACHVAVLLWLTGCSWIDGARTELGESSGVPAAPPPQVEDFAQSCELLCAVPGGVEECPLGTPCPRLSQDEADKVFDSTAAVVYGASDPSKACADTR